MPEPFGCAASGFARDGSRYRSPEKLIAIKDQTVRVPERIEIAQTLYGSLVSP